MRISDWSSDVCSSDLILSVEDPIEFVHTSQKCLVNQREVHRDTHGFAEALRSALREDPDIILVGEMRDLETIRLALTAAETGHLLFGTLHRSEEHTSELPSLMRISYAVFCLKNKIHLLTLSY